MNKIDISCLTEYMLKIEETQNQLISDNKDGIIIYRGHADKGYKFEPSLFRNGNEEICNHEAELLKQIETYRPHDFSNQTTFEKLVKMQHYGFATRLLDVTSNMLIALYFAAQASKKKENGERCAGKMFICKVPQEFVKSFDDNTVVCLANLAKLSDNEKKQLAHALTRNNASMEACDEGIVKRFEKLIREEHPNFQLPSNLDLYTPVFVHAKQDNPRISAQSGAFIVFGLKNEKSDWTRTNIATLEIQKTTKKKLREALSAIKINRGTLFPELNVFLTYALKQAKNGEFDF